MKLFFAKWFAIFAHTSVGQKRKYTGEPYWKHPRDVANLLMFALGYDPKYTDAYCGAWLHDVVEDTWVKSWMIRVLFGKRVCDLVMMVTDISKPTDGNRAIRKALDRDHIAAADAVGKAIKICDSVNNTISIAKHDIEFAKVYMPEILALLDVLRGSIVPDLYIELEYMVSVEMHRLFPNEHALPNTIPLTGKFFLLLLRLA